MAKKKSAASASKGNNKSADTESKPAEGKLKAANVVTVRHILCEKHSKILEALDKLRQGKDFASVAMEYSEDKAKQGGSLGRMTRGSMVEPFQTEAFRLSPSTTSKPIYSDPPIKTKFGYHIVMVEKRG
ncbi:Peptidyl-prolyl cis-trans isomerase pin4 [Coemansia erecta]|uniref:Peptidyl-prolyl cis-trans isomerase n=1 Tax=Coemansia asiatica TaxID=1052880 RepID=A0A9W7XFM9_9FUNG|nr:Peptidyl-prolyl cis-trans isomerase pin4 [Coemansia asiatica]KAJ2847583.1 Peptidyl-prolyl cis-trans isomerase pin4 [Coemansia erecta]